MQPAEQPSARQIAARKAWDTMRAKKAALEASTAAAAPVVQLKPAAIVNVSTDADLAPRMRVVQPEPTPAPASDLRVVELWVDDAQIGCGSRLFIHMETGERLVRLFSPAKLVSIQVDRKFFERCHVPARKWKRNRLAEIIRRNVAMADRVNAEAAKEIISDGGRDAARALQLLAR